MKLTVLGNSGPYPSAERPCSGYVVELNNKLIILDLGSGTLMNFQKSYNIEDISFVILSHLHFDHMSDILVLRYALQVKKMKIDLYLPKQPKNISSVLACDEFNLIFINQNTSIKRDGFDISFTRTTHPVETYAIKVNNRFVYSADLSEPDDLDNFMQGVDTLLIDSAFLTIQKGNKKLFHLSASECAMIASRHRIKNLLLTHLPPDAKQAMYIDEAKPFFDNVRVVQVMQKIDM